MALFKRRRQQVEITNATLLRRRQSDQIEDGLIMNGCVEYDDYDEAICEAMSQDTISMSGWERGGDMPVFAWDSEFEAYMKHRQSLLAKINAAGCSWFPWDVLAHLPIEFKKSNKFAFSQQQRPSCSGHSAAFAHHMATLINIALGQPMIYNPANPICTWLWTKNGSYSGGQSIAAQANGVNVIGNFPLSIVGENNVTAPRDYMSYKSEAEKHQSGIVFMPLDNLEDRVVQVCKSGLAFFCGNSTKVSGGAVDRNGLRVASLAGSWAHACLEWNQKVYTSTGITRARELVGKEFVTLSYSARLGRMAAKKAYAWISGHKECVEVKTNIGTFTVTYDHPFMTKDGFIVRAANLCNAVGTNTHVGGHSPTNNISLFAMNTRMDKQGYPTVSLRDGLNNKTRISRLIGLDILGISEDSDGCVHHADGDPTNNDLSNLGILLRSEHSAHHVQHQVLSQKSRNKQRRSMQELYAAFPSVSTVLPEGVSKFTVKDLSVLTDRSIATVRRAARKVLGCADKLGNGERVFNRAEAAVILSSIKMRIQDVRPGRHHWKRPHDHWYGKRLIELSNCKSPSNIIVESVSDVGIKPIVSIEVFDDEPDDKRPWTEHNYMLVPEENDNRFLAVGVASGNTSVSSYVNINGEEYIYWLNSHGPRYTQADRFRAPADGCWMSRAILRKWLSTVNRYGKPAIIIPENTVGSWDSLEPIVKAPLIQ